MWQSLGRDRAIKAGLVVAVAVFAGITIWSYQLAKSVDGRDCEVTQHQQAIAGGLNFNHSFPSSLRDPVNGILVVAAVGQPYANCQQVFSTFRCTAQGPATVRVLAGSAIGYFLVPEGATAIVQGDGSGAMRCVLPAKVGP